MEFEKLTRKDFFTAIILHALLNDEQACSEYQRTAEGVPGGFAKNIATDSAHIASIALNVLEAQERE